MKKSKDQTIQELKKRIIELEAEHRILKMVTQQLINKPISSDNYEVHVIPPVVLPNTPLTPFQKYEITC